MDMMDRIGAVFNTTNFVDDGDILIVLFEMMQIY
jgi:hypothetical protein